MPNTLPEERLRQAYLYALQAATALGMTHKFLKTHYAIDRATSWRIRDGQPSTSLQDYLARVVLALDDEQQRLLHLAAFKSGDRLQANQDTVTRITRVLANITRISCGILPK